ncbi:MAG: glycine dehydrogenase subunit 1 [Chloroflexi bacterium]|nr:MAG: glycine dehydrogenase subunit 1 [Chloroflexota bacterium]
MTLSSHPYIPNTQHDRQEMMRAIGVASLEELFEDIPAGYRNPTLDLPPALSELGVKQDIERLAARNAHVGSHRSFLGGGAYNHFIPSVVGAMLNRGEFLTCYTPYQAEVAQGTLQVAFEFQSLVSQLMQMEVTNAGMYDGATALAEAALMACRTTGRSRIVLLDTISPYYAQVVCTYAEPQGLQVETTSALTADVAGAACLVVQSPNFFGYLEDMASLEKKAHADGGLFVVSMDPTAMGLFKPPGAYDADIATAEGQSLGVPLSYGGPYVGLFSCKEGFLRQMPGRIVGRTTDTEGREGYVLTLQAREQHIRRQRATSNICTSTHLVALAVAVHLATMGKQGLKDVATACYHKAHYAAQRIAALSRFALPLEGVFFKEFAVTCPIAPAEINHRLLERGIVGGLDVSNLIPNGMLIAITEMNSREDIDGLVDALEEVTR